MRYVCQLRHQARVALTCTGVQACCFPAFGAGSEGHHPHTLEKVYSASYSLATLWGILAKPTTGEGCSCQCGVDSFCAHSLHLSVQAWARKASWAAFLKRSLSTSEGWRRSVAVAECRVYRQGLGFRTPSLGSALVVDVEQRPLLAGRELGRGQHARGLHHDAHSRGAGAGAVLHLRPSCSRLRAPIVLLWTMTLTAETPESTLPCTSASAELVLRVSAVRLWTSFPSASICIVRCAAPLLKPRAAGVPLQLQYSDKVAEFCAVPPLRNNAQHASLSSSNLGPMCGALHGGSLPPPLHFHACAAGQRSATVLLRGCQATLAGTLAS